ncbi:hypothetical protein [Ancylobacter sp. IITR112]|uniref:hypothetical protein n=1 Tax=Ancylobacter sp. IITR112 TaxID=3138073 RepID=UPI00352AD6B2
MNEHVAIFLHVATIGRYNEVMNEVLGAISSSKHPHLIRSIEVNIVGQGEVTVDRDDPRLTLIRRHDDVTIFEIPTLQSIHNYSKMNPGENILYFNCLGGRHLGAGFHIRKTWRQMLYQYYIDDMRDCLTALSQSDACGIFWHEKPLPHFASNNWWAKADYIASLTDPAAFADRVEALNLDSYGGNWTRATHKRRHAAEFWIGSGAGIRPANLLNFQSGVLPRTFTGSYPWWDLPGIDWGRVARIARKRNAPHEPLLSSAQIVRAAARYHLKKAYDRAKAVRAGS